MKEISSIIWPSLNLVIPNFKDAKLYPFSSTIAMASLNDAISSKCGPNGITHRPIATSYSIGLLNLTSSISIWARSKRGNMSLKYLTMFLLQISRVRLWARRIAHFIKLILETIWMLVLAGDVPSWILMIRSTFLEDHSVLRKATLTCRRISLQLTSQAMTFMISIQPK